MKCLYAILLIDIAFLCWARGMETNVLFVPQWVTTTESNMVVQTRIDGDTNSPSFHLTLSQDEGKYGFYQVRWKSTLKEKWGTIAIGEGSGKHVARIFVSTNSTLYADMLSSDSGFFTVAPQYVVSGRRHVGLIYRVDMMGFFPQSESTNTTTMVPRMELPPFPGA